MKKICVISGLLLIMAGFAVHTGSSRPQATEKEICDRVVMQIDSFSGIIANQLLPAAEDKNTDPQKLQQLFLASRLAYKKFEWAAEYFTATAAHAINGPPVQEALADGLVEDPAGLQLIEGYLYPGYDAANRQKIFRLLKSMISDCNTCKNYFRRTAILQWQVWDAARQESFRVLTLGITSFDSPLGKNNLNESACALGSVSQILASYPAGDANGNLKFAFKKAIRYLEANTSFDNFDRAKFITEYGNPLTAAITGVQQNLNLPPINEQRLLRPTAATLFDADAFNASAYSAYPEEHPTAKMIALGEKLFNDPLLSGNSARSCASCHQPARAFTDGMVANTVLDSQTPLKRNTPTLLNAAFQPAQFADMREKSLEGQMRAVIENKLEMHSSLKLISTRLSNDTAYIRLFAAAYPQGEVNPIGQREITSAISAYLRTLSVLNSRFDAYMRGNRSAMNTAEINGFNLFMGKARCGSCHYMPLFNGTLPPAYKKMDAEVIGVPATLTSKKIDDDRGRNGITHALIDDHAFKTPSLRNAAKTPPYMHNGVFTTLEQVIDFYDRGGGTGMGIKIDNQTLPAEPLKLSASEKTDLIAFINCLNNQ